MLSLRAELRSDSPMADERRAARRTLHLEVSAHSPGDAAQVLIHNLSETGLLLETSADLHVGECIQVDLPHTGTTRALVVWSRGDFAGCEFLCPVTKAAISAALLRNPVSEAERPQLPASWPDSDYPPIEPEDLPARQTAAILALLVFLVIVVAFLVALLSFPFSLQ